MKVEYVDKNGKLGRVCDIPEMSEEEFIKEYDAEEILSITDDYDIEEVL